MDITCCDLEAAIIGTSGTQFQSASSCPTSVQLINFRIPTIARNIIVLTLIIDKPEGRSDAQVWDIYYHIHIDKPCLDKLQAPVRKLLTLAVSTNAWEQREYGDCLKFCDADTPKKVRAVWEFYVSQNHDKDPKVFENFFKSGIDRAREMRRKRDFCKNLTGLRSAGPTWAEAFEDMPDLHDHFWNSARLT